MQHSLQMQKTDSLCLCPLQHHPTGHPSFSVLPVDRHVSAPVCASRLFPAQAFGRRRSACAGKILEPASGADGLPVTYRHPHLGGREETGHHPAAVLAGGVLGDSLQNCGFSGIYFCFLHLTTEQDSPVHSLKAAEREQVQGERAHLPMRTEGELCVFKG